MILIKRDFKITAANIDRLSWNNPGDLRINFKKINLAEQQMC